MNCAPLELHLAPGVGKTHLGIALGVAASTAGYRTLFTSAVDLVHTLQSAHLEGMAPYKLLHGSVTP